MLAGSCARVNTLNWRSAQYRVYRGLSEIMGNHHDDLARLASFFGGEEAINVVKALAQAGTTTDDVIATQANVRLNTARKVHWKLQPDQLDTFVRSRKKKALETLRTRLEFEKGHSFFMCKECLNVRVTFE